MKNNKKEAIEVIGTFSGLKENWDSYGGHPPTQSAIDRAKKLIGMLWSPDIHIQPSPNSIGGVQVDISFNGTPLEVEVDIPPEFNKEIISVIYGI